MGEYCYPQWIDFFIPKEKFDDALQALKDLEKKIKERDRFQGPCETLFMRDTLEAQMTDWGWIPEFDEEGNISDLEIVKDKIGAGEELLWNALAPFVRAGSYIEWFDGGNNAFRWFFTGKRCVIQEGEVVFPEVEVEA